MWGAANSFEGDLEFGEVERQGREGEGMAVNFST